MAERCIELHYLNIREGLCGKIHTKPFSTYSHPSRGRCCERCVEIYWLLNPLDGSDDNPWRFSWRDAKLSAKLEKAIKKEGALLENIKMRFRDDYAKYKMRRV